MYFFTTYCLECDKLVILDYHFVNKWIPARETLTDEPHRLRLYFRFDTFAKMNRADNKKTARRRLDNKFN